MDESAIYSQKIALAKKKNFIKTGSKPDLDKAHRYFINFLRDLKGVTYD